MLKEHLKGTDPCSLHTAAKEISSKGEAIRPKPKTFESGWGNWVRRYQVAAYHHIENGFDDKLDYNTLGEAEAAASGYVDGTMEPDGFKYDGAAVYDKKERRCIRIYGDYPDERAHMQVQYPALAHVVDSPAELATFMRGYAQALEDIAQLQLDDINKKMAEQGKNVTLHEDDYFFVKDNRPWEWDDNSICHELIETDDVWRRFMHECQTQELGPECLNAAIITNTRIWVICNVQQQELSFIQAQFDYYEQGRTFHEEVKFDMTEAELQDMHKALNHWAKETSGLETIEEYARVYVFKDGVANE